VAVEVTAGQATAGFMASVTCGLTAEDRDQLRNTTLVSSMGLQTDKQTERQRDSADMALMSTYVSKEHNNNYTAVQTRYQLRRDLSTHTHTHTHTQRDSIRPTAHN